MSFDVAKMAVEAAMKAGADYADARTGDRRDRVAHRPQPGDGGHRPRPSSTGVGIRVLVDGSLGFAATVAAGRTRGRHAHGHARRRDRAGGLPPARATPFELAPVEPVVASWRGPMEEDPFTVPLEEKVALLMEAHAPSCRPSTA